MKPVYFSLLGVLAILSGCEFIGSKEITRWHTGHRDRAHIVFSSPASKAKAARASSRGVDETQLDETIVAYGSRYSANGKHFSPIVEQPNAFLSEQTKQNGTGVSYAVDANGTVQLPPTRRALIIDLDDIRSALRGSAGLEFDQDASR